MCFRSPRKKARILYLVTGHKNFMHGYAIKDQAENLIRVLDFIKGQPLYDYVQGLGLDHQTYFYNRLPVLLNNFIESLNRIPMHFSKGANWSYENTVQLLDDLEAFQTST